MSVQKLIKKEVLAMGGGSGTRVNVAPNPKLINLGAGDPDFNQPEFINKAVYDAMKEGKTHYEFGGVPEFRKAIAEYYSKFGYAIKDPSGQIAI
jgi:aspartate/methionine/tyrosine aminotransferase